MVGNDRSTQSQTHPSPIREKGHLWPRPQSPNVQAVTGLHPLGLHHQRDGWLYIPTSYHQEKPAPLVLMLHGAGGNAQGGLVFLQAWAETLGIVILAVDSRRTTWDMISLRDYGPDVEFINQALAQTFAEYAIDPHHLAIAGFSDGASYALSLGIMNGDLFTHILAFSPGYLAPLAQRGIPQIFISHGTDDRILSIERCSRRIVPLLQEEGYPLHYEEFQGGHVVLDSIVQDAFHWFMNPH